ncbi:MAG: Gfo/Idh/MocA family oxidoreductase [Patescibacteria group bacterium]
MNKKNICIIGVGQIGSRHLQALKGVKIPLNIWVVDSLTNSLKIAKERYESMSTSGGEHVLHYQKQLPESSVFDVAIIATTSGPRAALTKELLKKNKIKYLILEKLLFNKKNDYATIGKLLKNSGVKAWVNCSMRIMPFYRDLKKEFNKQKLTYILHGNQSGLASDLIHHLDFMAYLTGSKDFSLDTRLLDKKTKSSKRKGYLEITGILIAEFGNGSIGFFRCDDKDFTPKLIEIFTENKRYIIKEYGGKAIISKSPDWQWQEIKAPIPYQSQLTTTLVEELLTKGGCNLPTFEESSKYHLLTLGPLLKFLNKISKKKYNYYPFT